MIVMCVHLIAIVTLQPSDRESAPPILRQRAHLEVKPLHLLGALYLVANSPLSFMISRVISAAAYMSFTSSHSLTV